METLAHLALIARYGDRWFRGVGLPSATGSSLVTISGDVARPGVYEIELGTPIGTVIAIASRSAPAAAGHPGRRLLRRLDASRARLADPAGARPP